MKEQAEYESDVGGQINEFEFRATISRFADRTSVVGPPFIISSNNWAVRSIWIILFLGAIGVTIWQVYMNTSTYLSWPVKTDVSLNFAVLSFPVITICNSNPIRESQLHLGSPNLLEFLQSLNPENFKRNETLQAPPAKKRRRRKRFLDEHQRKQSFNKTFIPDNFFSFKDELGGTESVFHSTMDEFKYLYGSEDEILKREMGHQLDDMLLSCSFETRECDSRSFTHVSSNKYGNCFSFNSNGNLKSRRWGSYNGFSVSLYMETHEYVKGLTNGYGLRVAISEPGKKPFPDVNGFFVSAGTETDVGVRMINVSRLGTPYGECEKSDTYKKSYGVEYSKKLCQETCSPRTILVTCSCFERAELYRYPLLTETSYPECFTPKDYVCLNNIKRSFIRNKVQCRCPRPCNETTFNFQTTSRQWPSREYLHALIDGVCRDEFESGNVTSCNRLIEAGEQYQRRNFLLLNVFYRDLNYEVMKEAADYPIDKYLSDLGGSIGLGLGMCILGFFEILHLLIEVILFLVYKCKNSRRQRISVSKGNRIRAVEPVFPSSYT